MLKQDYEIGKQEDEDLRCPICNFYFSDVTKPYLLPCNHNLCFSCIDRIMKKNMLYCPMCRKPFNKEDRTKFQVNFPFLNLVLKILKTKVIYCSNCLMIFNWTEHQSKCDEGQFKETNEIFDEIKLLASDCIRYLENIDKIEKMKEENIKNIINIILRYEKNLSNNFLKNAKEVIESFYNNIPVINIEALSDEIAVFIKLCEPIYSSLNLNIEEINNLICSEDRETQQNNTIGNKLIGNYQGQNKSIKISMRNETQMINNNNNNNSISRTNNDDSKSKFDKINYVISILNKIKNTKINILNYSRQVEFTTETIKSQIDNNYNNYNELISLHLHSLYDSLTIQKPKEEISANNNNNKVKEKEKEKEKIFFVNYITDTKKIWLFDLFKNKSKIIGLSFLNNTFNSSFSIAYDAISNLVYITGGKTEQSVSLFSNKFIYSDQCIIFPFREQLHQSDIITIQIPRKKAMHSSLFHNNKLFIIGGENQNKNYLRECECFNTKDKVWELMPKMNNGRIYPSLCIYNNKFLYVFQGEKEQSNRHFEFINIENFNCNWKEVQVEDPGDCYVQLKKSGACAINENQILICGGIENINNKEKIVPYTYIFNPIKKCIYRSNDLEKSAYFSQGGIFIKKTNKIYIIDEENETKGKYGVHIYDITKHFWFFNS